MLEWSIRIRTVYSIVCQSMQGNMDKAHVCVTIYICTDVIMGTAKVFETERAKANIYARHLMR